MSETGKKMSETGKKMSETGKKSSVEPSNARARVETGDRRQRERGGRPLPLDPTKNNGTLPNGKPDDPYERAKLGYPDLPPDRHPDYKPLGYPVQNRLTQEYADNLAYNHPPDPQGYAAQNEANAGRELREIAKQRAYMRTPKYKAWVAEDPGRHERMLAHIEVIAGIARSMGQVVPEDAEPDAGQAIPPAQDQPGPDAAPGIATAPEQSDQYKPDPFAD